MVAIGPLHNRKLEQYQHMEKVKWWYLHKYVLTSEDLLVELIAVIKRNEEDARACYAESLDIKSNEFIEMMILDGCFLLELFRKFTYKKRDQHRDGSGPSSGPREEDPILSMDCMIQYICHDILLLENQLPWVVLQSLYTKTQGDYDCNHKNSLSVLILDAFTFLPSVGNHCKAYKNRIVLIGPSSNNANHKHVLDLVRTSVVFSLEVPPHDGEKSCPQTAEEDIKKVIPPATALSKGGVKFESISDNGKTSIIRMEFKDGVLRIPQLVIGELTETLFRNFIAYEQCSQSHSYEITSYAVLMNKLISSKEDMEFLCEQKIIRNWLSAEDGFKCFNKIHNDTFPDNFHYEELCTSVNGYYNVKYFRWMEILWRKYFDNPWTIISLMAAIILLVLTLVQTIFAVLDSGIVFFMQ